MSLHLNHYVKERRRTRGCGATQRRMADCRTVRHEASEYDFFASVGDHRESRRRFRIVPGALIYGGRSNPSTHRIKKSDVKSLDMSIHPCEAARLRGHQAETAGIQHAG